MRHRIGIIANLAIAERPRRPRRRAAVVNAATSGDMGIQSRPCFRLPTPADTDREELKRQLAEIYLVNAPETGGAAYKRAWRRRQPNSTKIIERAWAGNLTCLRGAGNRQAERAGGREPIRQHIEMTAEKMAAADDDGVATARETP